MLATRTTVNKALCGAVVLVLLLPSMQTWAQESSLPVARGDGQRDSPLEQFRQRLQQGASASAGIPLEGAVDPEQYRVGPGDLFSISIGGLQPAAITVPVSADGRLILPEGGVIQAAGRVLADVREDALRQLARRYSNVSVDVSLAQPRQFYVHVVGAVPIPGRYLALPVARVSDVLQFAFADTLHSPVVNLDYRPSLRNIQVQHRDGTTASVDLARYFSEGSTDLNPYVRDGDIISVSAYRAGDRAVFVNGAVPFPGTYDFRPDDTLEDLLRVGGLTGDLSEIGTVRLARRGSAGSTESRTFTGPEIAGGAGATRIQPLDHVSVEPQRRIAGTAIVEGYIRYPGTYDIDPGVTTLQDLVELAGGIREDALIRGAFLQREVLPEPRLQMARQNRFEQQMLDLNALKPDTVEIMRYLRQSDLDFMSRTQFAQGLRIQNRVSVDLESALSPGSEPVYLQDGDRLIVPQDKQSVFVFGQVERPGFVPYQRGQSAEEYIAQVGGRNALGRAVYVIEAGTGRHVQPRSASIQSGDLIFVDSRLDIADTAELQRLVLEENRATAQARTQWIQAMTQTVFALASVVSLYVTLRNR